MQVVADTSPLQYLILIGQTALLSQLFEKIAIPSIVLDEMLNRGSPNLVRDWAHAPPTWLTVAEPPLNADPTLEHLDAGEAAVILLALDCKASLVLMDDRAGASAARSHGLTVTGTVGVLDRAASRGMTDLPAAVARLRETNFRYRPALLNELLARHST